MSSRSVSLLPQVHGLVEATAPLQSLPSLQVNAVNATRGIGQNWQKAYQQLHNLQDSDELQRAQKLQLASCERHFLSFYVGFDNCERVYHLAAPLLSRDELLASTNLLCSCAQNSACGGDFERALGHLSEALDWVRDEPLGTAHASVFGTAVFVSLRMGENTLAQQLTQTYFEITRHLQLEIDLQLAQFKRLNCNRLLGIERHSAGYQLLLKKQEKGLLKIDALNLFLLPVYAAHAALDMDQPDCRGAARAIAIAATLTEDASDYALAQYLSAQARLRLAQGDQQGARNAVVEAECVFAEADVSLRRQLELQRLHLGLGDAVPDERRAYRPASGASWLRLLSKLRRAEAQANAAVRAG